MSARSCRIAPSTSWYDRLECGVGVSGRGLIDIGFESPGGSSSVAGGRGLDCALVCRESRIGVRVQVGNLAAPAAEAADAEPMVASLVSGAPVARAAAVVRGIAVPVQRGNLPPSTPVAVNHPVGGGANWVLVQCGPVWKQSLGLTVLRAVVGQVRRAARGRARPWVPIIVGAIVWVALSLVWRQWQHPFLWHDDWDMLLPDRGTPNVMNHATRVLREGRWLNYAWWALGSQGISPRAATVLVTAGWLVTVCVLVRSLQLGWWSVVAVIAMASAPMASELSYWPATLLAPIWVLALTLIGLWWTRQRQVAHALVLVVGTSVVVMGYPTLALVIVPFLVAVHRDKTWRHLLILSALFSTGYAAGLLAVFVLNDVRFGVFGVEIQAWRNPTPLQNWTSLIHHLHVAYSDWRTWLSIVGLPCLLAAVVAAISLLRQPQRRGLLVLAASFAIAAIANSLSALSDGVSTPTRAMLWTWPYLVIITGWALTQKARRDRLLAAAVLIILAATATYHWATLERTREAQAISYANLEREILAQRQAYGPLPITFARSNRAPISQRIPMWILEGLLAKEDGIHNDRSCGSPRACATLFAFLTTTPARGRVVEWGHSIIVRLPGHLN